GPHRADRLQIVDIDARAPMRFQLLAERRGALAIERVEELAHRAQPRRLCAVQCLAERRWFARAETALEQLAHELAQEALVVTGPVVIECDEEPAEERLWSRKELLESAEREVFRPVTAVVVDASEDGIDQRLVTTGAHRGECEGGDGFVLGQRVF